jgi:hypothetical protein
MKKITTIVFALLMFACSTVHKTSTTTKQNVDSTSVQTKDTSNVSTVTAKDANFTAKGIDITVNYDKTPTATPGSDTVKWTPLIVSKKKISPNDKDYAAEIIQNAIGNVSNPGNISSITVHIDSVGTTDNTITSKDSSSSKLKDSTKLKSDTKTNVTTKVSTGLGTGAYLIITGIALVIIVVVVIKFGFKLI